MSQRPFILAIGGSPRPRGNSDTMLAHALAGAEAAGAEVRAVHLRKVKFAPCIGCEKCREDKACTGLKDGMADVYPLIDRATGLILASPAHNYNVTALMKGFIDRLYCYYDFGDERPGPWSSRLAGQGRKAALIGVCEQKDEKEGMGLTMEAMRLPLTALGYELAEEVAAFNAFAKGKVNEQADVLERCHELGQALARDLS